MRAITKKDKSSFLALLKASGLFEDDEVKYMKDLVEEHLKAGKKSEDIWLVDEGDDEVIAGVAYASAEEMADRVWNLYLLAVHPDYQKQGRGRALVGAIEAAVSNQEARMLLIETSGTPDMRYVRDMYLKLGYDQEGTVRDFYCDGEDKVSFRKKF